MGAMGTKTSSKMVRDSSRDAGKSMLIIDWGKCQDSEFGLAASGSIG